MGSRKDIIKRSLGITEYPWSSEDEFEEAPEPAEELNPRVPPAELRPTAPDAPGPSGSQGTNTMLPQFLQQHQQQQQTMEAAAATSSAAAGVVTRQQARQDRELFWSFINSPNNRVPATQSARSRTNAAPGLTRLRQVPASEIWANAFRGPEHTRRVDLQRITEFKRLTRNLGLRHRAHIAGVIPVTRVSRGAMGPSEANSSIIINRHVPIARLTRTTTMPRTSTTNGRTSPRPTSIMIEDFRALVNEGVVTYRDRTQGARVARSASDAAVRDRDRDLLRAERTQPDARAVPSRPPVPVHSSEDEANNNPTTPSEVDPEERNEGNGERDVSLERNLDIEQMDTNDSTNVNLDETDIVPIDLDNSDPPQVGGEAGTSASTSGQDDTDGRFSTEFRCSGAGIDANLANTSLLTISNVSANDAAERCAPHNTPTAIDNTEPGTVKEFNQNLLRLLECPVCLEWMEPPMSQCRRGHLVCRLCRARLVSCPVCRTTFSSVRNRAMEGVAELLRYPCRHGCGREVRLRQRAPHEASCVARKYQCPAPLCAASAPLPLCDLDHHFRSQHLTMMKIGRQHKFSVKVNTEQHDSWLILAMEEYFYMRIDVDIRTWGVVVLVSYIGPKCDAKNYMYEVTIDGQRNQRKLVYARTTHSDLENSSLNVCRQDCFHLTLDQALNFLRMKNRRCDSDKYLDFSLDIAKVKRQVGPIEESDS